MNLFGLSSATYSQIFTDSIPANSGISMGFIIFLQSISCESVAFNRIIIRFSRYISHKKELQDSHDSQILIPVAAGCENLLSVQHRFVYSYSFVISIPCWHL